MRRLGAAALTLACAVVSTGCTSHPPAATVRLTVSPGRALLDAPVAVTVTGLRSGAHATLAASAVDAFGVRWRSTATFIASATGTVTTRQRPIAGSYDDTDPMGWLDRMRPESPSLTTHDFEPAGADYQVSVAVAVDGKALAETDVRRLSPVTTGIRIRRFRPPASGIFANLYLPKGTTQHRPAVLCFGGSEGGLSETFEASLLAAHGYPAMALAYFGAPGLPAHLKRIPLEYFVRALHVLQHLAGVDRSHLLVWGVSRGSEAALLLGAHFPNLVHGVVAAVPSSVANVSLPDEKHAAWTLSGRALPFAPRWEYGYPQPSDGRGIIPVEQIDGPILLICGAEDELWPSCAYSDAIADRAKARNAKSDVTELTYATAGHAVGGVLPYVAITSPDYAAGESLGGSVAGDVLGRIDAWQHILKLLAGLR